MNVLTAVLKLKRSVSSSIFLIVRCNTFNSASVDLSSFQILASPPAPLPTERGVETSLKNSLHNFRRKRCTPSIPFVSQGLLASTGPRNISYMRKVSAPYFNTRSSGLTVLNLDLDIFSTSELQIYFPSSSRINVASLYSGFHFLKALTSNSMSSTMLTSTCNSSSLPLYSGSFILFAETKVFVPVILNTNLLLPWIIPWFNNFLYGSSNPIMPRSNKT